MKKDRYRSLWTEVTSEYGIASAPASGEPTQEGKMKSILKWTVIVHLGALQWKNKKKKQKRKNNIKYPTSIIGTGDLGFNIFIKLLPTWMPDEKDRSLLLWHLGFLKFHYLFSSSGFIFRKIEQSWSTFLNTSLLLNKKSIIPLELSSLFPVMLFSQVPAGFLVPVYRLLQDHWLLQIKKHLLEIEQHFL